MIKRAFHTALLLTALAAAATAQVTPAAGFTPPDDTPKFNIGATVFADYTYVDSPTVKDADGNTIHSSAFNVARSYVNVTGNLNHWISFRITPDVSRETGTGSSLNGSLTFRVKYAFAQFALDDWTTHGSWVRFGIQQTPFVDYTEGIYRYRFQGTIFSERVGLLTSSDAGVSGRYVFPGNYGDVHAGYYNGEGYSRAETNNEKAVQVRGTLRPLPLGGIWKGLRFTGFVDEDHYVQGASRRRTIEQVTFEHPRFNAGAELLQSRDQTSVKSAESNGKGWSVWATPKLGTKGWELLLRHDDFKPANNLNATNLRRNIVGVAYWFPNLTRVTSAVLLDRDSLRQTNFTPFRPTDTRYGVKLLINF